MYYHHEMNRQHKIKAPEGAFTKSIFLRDLLVFLHAIRISFTAHTKYP